MADLIKGNIKPLLYHIVVVVIASLLNLGIWSGARNDTASFIVFLVSLGIYFTFGFFIKEGYSISDNIQKVVLIPIVSFILYIGVLLPNSQFEGSIINSFELLYFISIQPFLYFTGLPADFNHPFLFAIVPSLMLCLGLYSKIVKNKLCN